MIMRWQAGRWCVVPLLGLALALPGCWKVQEAAQRAQRSNDLKAIGLAYHSHLDANGGKAPTRATDLQPYLTEFPHAIQGLNDGSIVFLYGVRLTEMTEGASQTVLAYEKDVPANGGLVVMADGTPRQVTPQEFQKLPQAKPKNPK
jgi:hypothetical protein